MTYKLNNKKVFILVDNDNSASQVFKSLAEFAIMVQKSDDPDKKVDQFLHEMFFDLPIGYRHLIWSDNNTCDPSQYLVHFGGLAFANHPDESKAEEYRHFITGRGLEAVFYLAAGEKQLESWKKIINSLNVFPEIFDFSSRDLYWQFIRERSEKWIETHSNQY